MSAIGVGDVVVCVDARAAFDRCSLVKGRLYRVIAVRGFVRGNMNGPPSDGIKVLGATAHPRSDGFFGIDRFRKIDAADDTFTASIHRRQPVEA